MGTRATLLLYLLPKGTCYVTNVPVNTKNVPANLPFTLLMYLTLLIYLLHYLSTCYFTKVPVTPLVYLLPY